MPEMVTEGFGQRYRIYERITVEEVRARWSVDHAVGLLIRRDGVPEACSLKSTGYLHVKHDRRNGQDRTEMIHRLIFAHVHGWFPEIVDHINGNPLDNRPDNLRESTPKLNALNRKGRVGSTFDWVGGPDGGYRVWVVSWRDNLSGNASTKADAIALEAELRKQAGLDLLAKLRAEDARQAELQRAWAVAAAGVDPVSVGVGAGLIVPPPPKWINDGGYIGRNRIKARR